MWFSKITKPLSSTISDDWHLRSRPCIQALVLPCQRSFFNISSSVHVGHAMPRPFYVLTRNTTIEPPPVRSNPGTSALARNFLQGTRLCDDIYSFVSLLWIFLLFLPNLLILSVIPSRIHLLKQKSISDVKYFNQFALVISYMSYRYSCVSFIMSDHVVTGPLQSVCCPLSCSGTLLELYLVQ